MPSNVVKILQTIASSPSFDLCLSTLQQPLALYKGPIVISVFIYKDKNVHGKYLSFATLGSYVACLGAKVFKFPWRERETKTGLCSSSDSLQKKSWGCEKALLGKIIFPFVIMIFWTVLSTLFRLSLYQGDKTIFFLQKVLFHIITQ